MSLYDFNAPVKYSPPAPSGPNLRPLLIGIGVLVAIGVVGGGIFMFATTGAASGDRRETRLAWLMSVPPAKVATGTAKTWRKLTDTHPIKASGIGRVRPPAVVGHFDSPQDQQVLLIGMDTPTYVYQVDGKSRTVPFAKFDSITRFTTWDYNRDGYDELVPDSMGLAYLRNMDFPLITYGAMSSGVGWSIQTADGQGAHLMLDMRDSYTPLYGINGKEKMSMSGGYTFGQVLYGDLDGDGKPEMLIKLKKAVDTFSVFGGSRAERIRDIKPESNAKSCFCGDLDGSGKDALVNLEGPELALYDIKGGRTALTGWPDKFFPTLAVDLDGDHHDEVIAVNSGLETEDLWDQGSGKFKVATPTGSDTSLAINEWWQKNCQARGGYFNPKTKQWVDFKFPDKGPNWIYNIFQSIPSEVAVGDFDHTGQLEIATKPSTGTALFIFNLKGECIYYEEFGDVVFAMGKVRSGGKDYLMLQTPSKLLIYP